MPFEVDIYKPRTMMAAIKKTAPNNSFFRTTFFNQEKTFYTKSIDIDIKRGNLKCAPYVSRKIGGKIIANSGYETNSYTPPLLAPEKLTTIDDILARAPGDPIYGGKTPEIKAAEKLVEDMQELRDMHERRQEQMCAEIFTTGMLTIKGEGVDEVIDFKLTNKETLEKTKMWGTDKADPIEDLDRWKEAVRTKSFNNPDIIIMGKTAVNKLLHTKSVLEMLDVKNVDMGVLAPRKLPNGVTYIGSLAPNRISIYTYSGSYTDDWTNPEAPKDKPFVPDNAVIVASTNANYIMGYGAVEYAEPNTNTIKLVEAKYVPDTYVLRKPPRRFLNLSSSPLPIPAEIDSWFVATVC